MFKIFSCICVVIIIMLCMQVCNDGGKNEKFKTFCFTKFQKNFKKKQKYKITKKEKVIFYLRFLKGLNVPFFFNS